MGFGGKGGCGFGGDGSSLLFFFLLLVIIFCNCGGLGFGLEKTE
ncbi:MAG: sporulation protein YjcZ [Clostridia bacterium]|nr:sporulation protein YjcZ [Clostridia bacterium]